MGGKGLCERIDGLSRDGECVREEINLHRDVFMAIWSECFLMKKIERKEEKLGGRGEMKVKDWRAPDLLYCTVPAACPIQVTWGCFLKDLVQDLIPCTCSQPVLSLSIC